MKLLKSILYFCFAILFFGCVDEDPPVEDIIFHIEKSDVKAYSTMITITHNATNRDPYYCFIVEGTAIDLQHEIANFLASTPSSELAEFKHYQRKSYFQMDLSAQNAEVFTSEKKKILWMYGLIQVFLGGL